MSERVLLLVMLSVGAAVVAGAALFLWPNASRVSPTVAYSVPNSQGMTADVAHDLFYRLAPALLLEVHAAFNIADTAQLRDTLATVSDGPALTTLLDGKDSPLRGGGLNSGAHMLHEIELQGTQVSRKGAELILDATWQVIGTIEDTEHLHVRGNIYRADLRVAPVDGAWRITEFTLLDVDESTAGQKFVPPDAPGAASE